MIMSNGSLWAFQTPDSLVRPLKNRLSFLKIPTFSKNVIQFSSVIFDATQIASIHFFGFHTAPLIDNKMPKFEIFGLLNKRWWLISESYNSYNSTVLYRYRYSRFPPQMWAECSPSWTPNGCKSL